MSTITVTRSINAPIDVVFRTVAHINEFSQAVPHIVNVEFLTEQHTGAGTRFRETRLMHGKEAVTELEVTEYVENDHVRIVTDSHGAVWDTIFTVSSNGGPTELTMVMESRPYKLAAKVMNPLIGGMIRKAVEKDMDLVQEYCETQGD